MDLKFEGDDYSASLRTSDTEKLKYWIEQGFPEMGSSGYFFIDGDQMIKSDNNNFWALNDVYRFEGPTLVEAFPFSTWKLRQMPGAEVVLYRQMSTNESALWKNGQVEKLGAAHWGFGEAQGEA